MPTGKPQTSSGAAVHRAEHVFRLVERLRLSWLLAHLPPTAVWAAYVFVNSFATIGLLAALASPDAQSICVSVARSHRIPVLFHSAGGNRESPQCRSGACRGTLLWLCCLFSYGHEPSSTGSTGRDLLAAGFISRAFALAHGGHHGASAHQSSACRCDHYDCFAWDHLQTRISCNDRSSCNPTHGTGASNKPARGAPVSGLANTESAI
jgi:hypothetical protein